MRARALLQELMAKHPDWNWEDLEDQGFVEIMQAFRFAPEGEQTTVVLAFTVVKEYIRRLLTLEEQRIMDITPKKLSYENKLYYNGYTSGFREFQLRAKKKKTRIERKYIEIADKFNIDLQTVILLSSFVNGYNRTKEQLIQWAKKQYSHNKNSSYGDYYRWLSTFLEKLSPEDFALLHNKPTNFTFNETTVEINGKPAGIAEITQVTVPLPNYVKERVKQLEVQPKPVSDTIRPKPGKKVRQNNVGQATVGIKTDLHRVKPATRKPLLAK